MTKHYCCGASFSNTCLLDFQFYFGKQICPRYHEVRSLCTNAHAFRSVKIVQLKKYLEIYSVLPIYKLDFVPYSGIYVLRLFALVCIFGIFAGSLFVKKYAKFEKSWISSSLAALSIKYILPSLTVSKHCVKQSKHIY